MRPCLVLSRLLSINFSMASAFLVMLGPAAAGCFPSAEAEPRFMLAATKPTATIRYLGHSSFEIETANGTRIVTDYNGVHRAKRVPNIVTMNNAHSTHFTNLLEPEIDHALRGWGQGNAIARHRVELDSLVIRNIPTSVHGRTGSETNSNSIFVFEVEDLCIAHLGHLHHILTDLHLGELGIIDILFVPIDGTWTMSHHEMAMVVRQIRPSIAIPMHFYGHHTADAFASNLPSNWSVNLTGQSTVAVSRLTMPYRQFMVLEPENGF